MKPTKLRLFVLVASILMAMVLFHLSPFTAPTAHAWSGSLLNNVNLGNAPWWSGACDTNGYNSGHYFQPGNVHHSGAGVGASQRGTSNYRGIVACKPSSGTNNNVDVQFYSGAPAYEEEWQCTELVKRYLYQAFGTPDTTAADGWKVADTFKNDLLQEISNNAVADIYPLAGDVLSFGTSDPGHTALVTSSTITNQSLGQGTVSILDQNNTNDPNGTGTLHIGSWSGNTNNPAWNVDTERDGNGNALLGPVTAWLQPQTQVSTATTSDGNSELFGVKAIAANTVIAVGTSDPGNGHSNQALVEQWNGANWSVITSGNAADNDVLLYAVDADSASNIWAVGEIDNPLSHSYVLKYNGSSWSQVTSVPDIGALSAVKVFSSSNVWVAGQSGQVAHYTGGTSWTTYTPTNVSHLYAINGDSTSDVWVAGDDVHGKAYVGQWTGGTNFTEATSEPNPANNSGDYDQITGIYAFASNSVWVSGFATPSSTGIQYGYVSHWNGSNWTNTTFSSGSTGSNLLGITALSTSNIWAVGFTDTGTQVVHYDGSTWTSLPNASNGTLYGITSLGTNGNTWAIGYNNQTRPVNALSEFYN